MIFFLDRSSLQVAPMKKQLCIAHVTLIPDYTDANAQWAYFKGADSRMVPRICTFYALSNIAQILCDERARY